MQIGQQVTEADFQKATEILGETGMFGDVSYRFEYSAAGATLDFQLSDNPQLVPARFDNFVWFSDQELMEKLHQRVPLFRGQLPLNGKLPDQISDALQGLLIERKVAGKADYLRAGDQEGPISAIAFNVEGVHIVVRNTDFSGCSSGPAQGLATSRPSAFPSGISAFSNTAGDRQGFVAGTFRARISKSLPRPGPT